eukprot:1195379-Prorocentrum_minimum.AAC.9
MAELHARSESVLRLGRHLATPAKQPVRWTPGKSASRGFRTPGGGVGTPNRGGLGGTITPSQPAMPPEQVRLRLGPQGIQGKRS